VYWHILASFCAFFYLCAPIFLEKQTYNNTKFAANYIIRNSDTLMANIIQASPIAKSIYGYTSASLDSWCNYGYALLVIAGADGEVSDEEMDWLLSVHEKMLQAPGEVIEALSTFDFREVNLEDILPKISFDVPIDYRRTLIYDAIKMSYADRDFADDERRAVHKAARLLNVRSEIEQTIEEITNMERATDRMRRLVLHIDLAYEELGATVESEIVDSLSLFLKMNFEGLSNEAVNSLADYGKALLTIAGADGEVSKEEIAWLHDYFMMIDEETGEDALEELEDFDYQSANLADILHDLDSEDITGKVRSSLRRTLLYSAIQMAKADQDYAQHEQETVEKARKLLDIDAITARMIHGLTETEESIETMRKAIFEKI